MLLLDDQPLNVLQIPARLNQLGGQPIEQFRMRRRLGLHAQIVGRLHQSDAEVMLPQSIDDNARRERILRAHEPSRQAQPISRRIGRQTEATRPAHRAVSL